VAVKAKESMKTEEYRSFDKIEVLERNAFDFGVQLDLGLMNKYAGYFR
jgi:hypothetical protein